MATRRVEDKNRLNFLALRMSAFGTKPTLAAPPLRPSEANLFGRKPYAPQSALKRGLGATPVLPLCDSNATPSQRTKKSFRSQALDSVAKKF